MTEYVVWPWLLKQRYKQQVHSLTEPELYLITTNLMFRKVLEV